MDTYQTRPAKFIIFILVVVQCLSHLMAGQGVRKNGEVTPTPPSAEKFAEVDLLLANSYGIPCTSTPQILHLPCYNEDGVRYRVNSKVRLFNADGTVWKWFEMNWSDPNYSAVDASDDIVPFATDAVGPTDHCPNGVMLRLVRESESWYEVEINENTRETRYALRSDPDWRMTEWGPWLAMSFRLKLSRNHPPLLDAPNGKVIPDSADIRFETAKFVRFEGDWVMIDAPAKPGMWESDIRRGWIRWRKGRQILVGCIFNRYVAP